MNTNYGSGTGPRAQQELRDQQERERLADDLARWAGDDAAREHVVEYAADVDPTWGSRRHGTYCCGAVRQDAERNEYAFAMSMPMDKLRIRHASELSDRAAIAQPAPAPDGETMTVGVGDAKEMPAGLAEELAGMSTEDRAVAERISDLGEIARCRALAEG